jgi:hypothetical protein
LASWPTTSRFCAHSAEPHIAATAEQKVLVPVHKSEHQKQKVLTFNESPDVISETNVWKCLQPQLHKKKKKRAVEPNRIRGAIARKSFSCMDSLGMDSRAATFRCASS